ncbi:MAG TPA: dienelactone hydrolase family protein [Candidatus Acidoferrum sp.]|nr:dienelactone hydrolase family protein [Candidatus Acidoferrum sp.]
MAEVLLFHHALGLTPGCRAFADELRAAGHVVHAPDLFDGQTFTNVADGVGHARQLGFNTILERGRQAAEGLPDEIVYAGFSLGVMPAQVLAQTRPGTRGALLIYACIPPSEFGGSWPHGVPLQIHMKEDDPSVQEGDLDAARQLAASTTDAELFLYPGKQHLFLERAFPDFDEDAAALAMKRVLGFLEKIPTAALRKG